MANEQWKGLGSLGWEAIPAISVALCDRNSEIRHAAMLALSRVTLDEDKLPIDISDPGREEVYKILLHLLLFGGFIITEFAIMLLGQLGDPRAVPYLVCNIKHERALSTGGASFPYPRDAIRALGRIYFALPADHPRQPGIVRILIRLGQVKDGKTDISEEVLPVFAATLWKIYQTLPAQHPQRQQIAQALADLIRIKHLKPELAISIFGLLGQLKQTQGFLKLLRVKDGKTDIPEYILPAFVATLQGNYQALPIQDPQRPQIALALANLLYVEKLPVSLSVSILKFLGQFRENQVIAEIRCNAIVVLRLLNAATTPSDNERVFPALVVIQPAFSHLTLEMAKAVFRLPIEAVLGDSAFDSCSIIEFIVKDLKAKPVIARNPRRSKDPDIKLSRAGIPTCAAGFDMISRGKYYDKEQNRVRHKFSCPIKMSKKFARKVGWFCPWNHTKFFSNRYGCTTNLRVDVDTSIRQNIDYGSQTFKKLYNLRSSTERIFSRLLSILMQRPSTKGLNATRNLCTIAHITVLVIALAAIKTGHRDNTRFVKSFIPNL